MVKDRDLNPTWCWTVNFEEPVQRPDLDHSERVLPPGHPLRGRAALRRGISGPAGLVSSWLRRVSPCVFGGKVWHTHRCRRPPLGFSLAWTLLSLQPRALRFPFSDSGTTAPRLLSAHPPAAPIPLRPHLRRQRQGDVPVRALPPFTRSRAASPSSARSRQRAHPRRLLRQPTAPSPRRRPHCREPTVRKCAPQASRAYWAARCLKLPRRPLCEALVGALSSAPAGVRCGLQAALSRGAVPVVISGVFSPAPWSGHEKPALPASGSRMPCTSVIWRWPRLGAS
ncbi:uncharacterized protein LOC119469642 [Cebus imitator]|uniref:uncharacterized protein LOC119469642 n=1 Tax=Cebus imitator TaxID=2715852 RepID=UPI001899A893|nr:uncharacterized protein LOC119469642 [Cebus imitator]